MQMQVGGVKGPLTSSRSTLPADLLTALPSFAGYECTGGFRQADGYANTKGLRGCQGCQATAGTI